MIRRTDAQRALDMKRMNLYLRDNPNCSLKDAAAVLGLNYDLVRKQKSLGQFKHKTPSQARQHEAAKQVRQSSQPGKPGRPPSRIPRAKAFEPAEQEDAEEGIESSDGGVVAPRRGRHNNSAADMSTDSLIAMGKTLKVSQIRAMIKAYLMASIADSKSVCNYAASLKALSSLQDVELEEIYETEKMIRIYVPEELPMPAEIKEVDAIEY